MADQETITITQTEKDLLMQGGKHEAEISMLIESFNKHAEKEESYLQHIFRKLETLQGDVSQFPLKLTNCKNETEKDILDHVSEHYYSKEDAVKDFRSLKWWMVGTVGGFTSAAGIIMWITTFSKIIE